MKNYNVVILLNANDNSSFNARQTTNIFNDNIEFMYYNGKNSMSSKTRLPKEIVQKVLNKEINFYKR